MKSRLSFLVLEVLVVLLACDGLSAQENSYIILHALNPEGVEIASIEGIWRWDVEIYYDDGGWPVAYGAHNEETHNQLLWISPGTHTIKVRFNGMDKEQGIDIGPGETKVLTFIFDRVEVDLVAYLNSIAINQSESMSGRFDCNTPSNSMDGRLIRRPFLEHFIHTCLCSSHLNVHYSASMRVMLNANEYLWDAAGRISATRSCHDVTAHAELYIGLFCDNNEGKLVIPFTPGFTDWFIQGIMEGEYPPLAVAKEHEYGWWDVDRVISLHDGPLSKVPNNKPYAVGWRPTKGCPGAKFPWNPSDGVMAEVDVYWYSEDLGPKDISITRSGFLKDLKCSSVPYDITGTGIKCEDVELPVASFTYSPENAVAGEEITFDASSSYDPDGEIVSYSWSFGDGNKADETQVTHTYNNAGDYTVTLMVTDNDGLIGSIQKIIVLDLSVSAWTSGHFVTCPEDWCDSASVPIHVQVQKDSQPVEGAEVFLGCSYLGPGYEDRYLYIGQTDADGYLQENWPIMPVEFLGKQGEFTTTVKAEYKGMSVQSESFVLYNIKNLIPRKITVLTIDEAIAYDFESLGQRMMFSVPKPKGPFWILLGIISDYFGRGYIPCAGDVVSGETYLFTAPDVAPAWCVRESVVRNGELLFDTIHWTEKEHKYREAIYGTPAIILPDGQRAMDRRGILATLASPGTLYVTAPDGSHAGYDPLTNELLYDFSIAISKPGYEPFELFIPHPIEGEYIFSVWGLESGSYTLTVKALDPNGFFGEESSFTTPIEEGQIHNYMVKLPTEGDITVIPPDYIQFTYVPAFGSHDNLQGRVSYVNPDDYKVAVYIYVPPYGWWTKPYASQPLTSIGSDGTWICDVTTNGNDPNATKIIAFLVPNGYNPPLGEGQQCLPSELYQYPYAEAIRYEKISFSGYNWWVKRAYNPVGPGPNYFSDSEENVWVDPNGYLHLRIAQRDGKWYCSEVIAEPNLGYGTYVFNVKGRVDLLDENIVMGLFTWEDCVPQYNYRELDIELSRWGDPANDNAQYVVQPWETPGNIYRFNIDLAGHPTEMTTHKFRWQQNGIDFQSYYGDFCSNPLAEDIIASWYYTGGDTPPAGAENPRINFWLIEGYPPTDSQDTEIVIKNFRYLPIGDFCGANSDQSDGYVDYWDLLYFAQRWHTRPGDNNWDPRCDLAEEDNYVDYWDLLVFAQQWHKGVKP